MKSYQEGMERLLFVVQELSTVRDIQGITRIVRTAARELTGADGATFVLRDAGQCHYIDEDAIGPLWKGKKFPIDDCISGWSMQHREAVVLEDIYQDPRIPADAYRPTFVKSLAMVPIRSSDPIGAIGNYWATFHKATELEVRFLQSLADSTSIALENVRLIEDLRASLAELERQLGLRDEFISVAAHELRTPLTPLALQTQFIQRLIGAGRLLGHPLENELRKFADVSRRQVADMVKLVENLLDASRLSLGHFGLSPIEGIDLAEVVRKTIEPMDSPQGSLLDLQLQAGVKGTWDPVRLGQVVRNVVSNAMVYGLGKPVIVRVEATQGGARLSVRDHGIGIEPEKLHRIFGRFERGTSVNRYGGMGLGLYISREIIQAHGGQINVESAPGAGSTFTVDLPVTPGRPAETGS